MGLFWVINDSETRVAVWRITETEEELYSLSNNGFKNKFTNPKRRVEWMTVRLILKFLKIDEPIEYTLNGRPFFSSGEQNISISHSGQMVAVALNPKLHVGVDVEHIDRRYNAIESKYLSEIEKGWIDIEDQKQMALTWCIKESVYKLPWSSSKYFTRDILIPELNIQPDGGTIEVHTKEQGFTYLLNPKYIFFDEYCLSWVTFNDQKQEEE